MRAPDWQSPSGNIRLYCGDCLPILRSMDGESVGMILTDCPYGHGNMSGDLQAARVRDQVAGARVKEAEPIANDAGREFEELMREFINQSARILTKDCCCCCCMAGGGPSPTFAKASLWLDEKLSFFQAVVWDKSARGNGMGWRYRRNYEFVMVAHRKGGRLLWADDKVAVPNVIRHPPVRDRVHPNEKPVEMMADFIRWHAKEDTVILDPFMGAGSTGLAAARQGKAFIGIELEERWFNLAVERIKEETERLPLFERELSETQGELW